MKLNRKTSGYSLVELMMAISIMAMLGVMLAGSGDSMIDSAKKRIARNAVIGFGNFLKARRASGDNLTTFQMVGVACVDCIFRNGQVMTTNFAGLAQNDTAWRGLGYPAGAPLDPWRRPYSFDANEQEWSAADCRWDVFESAGPDGIIWTTDDITVCIPHQFCPENPPAIPNPCIGM